MILFWCIIVLITSLVLFDLLFSNGIDWVLLSIRGTAVPYIGISPGHSRELVAYCDWLDYYGIKWRVLEEGETRFNGMTHLLLTGGADLFTTDRDEIDIKRYTAAMNNNIPIIGICRGMQLAAVCNGGSLWNHLPNEGYHGHGSVGDGPISQRPSSWHRVTFKAFKWLPWGKKIRVNSRHHQGVKDPGDWTPFAWSSDGLIEAMGDDTCLFVQWHPELEEVRDKPACMLVINWIKSTVTVEV